MTIQRRPRVTGVVVAFDDQGGFGEIEPDGSGGAPRLWFHCTALLDGSRHAEPGQRVTFRVVPGHLGRWEAADVAG